MLEQVSFPFSDTKLPVFSNSFEGDRESNPFKWLGIIIFIILFLAGGFLYVLYKQKQKEREELKKAEREKQIDSNDNV
ncbi:hypothetical protein GCM10011514_35900 [Emticicia aquatilis]|uniref:Uncharacterized protein n=1 Tax=Emticicia aquatilis TaxID=1537369 RepID=A0A916YZL2_9BACT|nr:hypothetical protein [Emticicia aquatilis]GGD68605.1 hypothetical protein GCM10011514_35900 [Emticicia aquatilis]